LLPTLFMPFVGGGDRSMGLMLFLITSPGSNWTGSCGGDLDDRIYVLCLSRGDFLAGKGGTLLCWGEFIGCMIRRVFVLLSVMGLQVFRL